MDKNLQVKRRQKVEVGGTVTYSAALTSEDGLVRLTVRSKDPGLFQIFKKEAWVPVRIGPDPQTTLDETAGA
jgi:hypothetical protein